MEVLKSKIVWGMKNEKMRLKVTGVYPVAKWKWQTGDMDSCLICSLGFGMACPSCSVGGDCCPLGMYISYILLKFELFDITCLCMY